MQNYPQSWSTEKIFFDSKDYFTHLIRGIETAKKSIEFESYIFTKDALGDQIVQALKTAAKKGVKVRVMVDGFGSPWWAAAYARELRQAGVECRVYHPLRWLTLLLHPFRLPNFIAHLNKRNHRKVCVVDRHRAWIGGMNVCAQHSEWRDTSAYVEGTQTLVLTQIFAQTWRRAWDPFTKRKVSEMRNLLKSKIKSYWVRFNSSRRLRRKAYHTFFNKIFNAKSRVWITNAYFVPTQKLIYALCFAAKNKVDVRLLVPRHSDVFFVHAVSSALYQELLESHVKIYEYKPRMLHAKTVLVDDWAIVGTMNLNHRSLLHDLEVEVVLSKNASVHHLEEQFLEDLRYSHPVSLRDWKNRSLWDRFLGRLLMKLRYWI